MGTAYAEELREVKKQESELMQRRKKWRSKI